MPKPTLQHILLANARARRALRERQRQARQRQARRPRRKGNIPPLCSFPRDAHPVAL